ncbi:MAG: LD-carboxypeptidase, partial [Pseudomonadota bacterium]
WFARGGYGSMRLLDGLTDELGPAALDKVYAGFSDTGALLATLYGAGIGTCVHAPMPANIRLEGGAPAILRTLEFLSAPPPPGRSGPPEAAFNLTILAALCGAPHFPNLAGHVLHLEDVGEYHYRIDRAFAQLAATPWFPALAGVRLGRFSEIPENNIDFGQTGEEIARAWCARAGVKVMADSPIGHDIHNGLVPFGPRPA